MIKTLKNLFIVGLLGLALLGCEESSSLEDQNWETFTVTDQTQAYHVNGKKHKIDDLNTTSDDGKRQVGAAIGNFSTPADYDSIDIVAENYIVKATPAEGVTFTDGSYVYDPDPAKRTLAALEIGEMVADPANAEVLKIGSPVATLEFYNMDDTEMTSPVGTFILML